MEGHLAGTASVTDIYAMLPSARGVGSGGIGLRGPGCPVNSVTHAAIDFDNVQVGDQVTILTGFSQNEAMAATYILPADAFPIKIDLIQALFGSVATVQTTTRIRIEVYEGVPGAGAVPLYSFVSSDDGIDPPNVVIPAAPSSTQAAVGNYNFLIDPNEPITEQMVIEANPSNSFTVAIWILQHHSFTGNACTTPIIPTTSNAFPCIEPSTCCTGSTLTHPTLNWLHGLNCGSNSCPPNGGWARFSNLAAPTCVPVLDECWTLSGCRPAGDWLLRAKWSSIACLPEATGACCNPATGGCFVTTAADCASLGRNYLGDGVACTPTNPCTQPTGACCVDGFCSILSQAGCTSAGGTYQGTGSACGGVNCPQPTGACCFGASCSVLAQGDCVGFGGVYRGNGVACQSGNQCPPLPTGACCFADGSCQVLSQGDCTGFGGAWTAGGSCEPNSCPQPTGACCSNSSSFCTVNTQAVCAGIPNTTWQGPGTACVNGNQCPAPAVGACCIGTACSVRSSAACAGAGGTYNGNGSTCEASGNPITCCPANFNGLGGVTVQDIYDFLTAWNNTNPSADFNGENGVTVQDIYDFLAAWSAGCPA